jgi:hypothetical protein
VAIADHALSCDDRGKRSMERQGSMLDASTIPTLVVGAIIGVVTVILWGRWQNRRGGDR